ncbi:hypothetical protein QBC32DRAFT_372288 [Pseudoneurospora amorphoporcata]|uniref:Uncharacterized protein n=1 Tax=Pseudoneurospora amorphoporcata TaxID=241081 RepID=A0AAN6NQL6_9PEZI|nr:hypothetical protein QBC32DRAFT_372288 [Pseudoneurospora amorphoporcata]
MAKTKTPTPNPASPAHKFPTPASPAYKFPTPGSPPAAGEPSEPNGVLGGEYWLQAGMPESDLDSTLGSDDESSTASIASSILCYRTINGHVKHAVNTGTASGLWAIDFADDLALVDIQIRFFDYIHVRFMTGAITDWDHLYEQAYRMTGIFPRGPSTLDQYGKLFEEAGRRLEMAAYLAHLRQGLKDKNIHAYWRWKIVYAQKPLE